MADHPNLLLDMWQQSFKALGLQMPLFSAPAISTPNPTSGTGPKSPAGADTGRLVEIQKHYITELQRLIQQSSQGDIPPPGDRRFSSPAWQQNPMSRFAAALYLLNSETVHEMVDSLQVDGKTKARINFATQQWIDASSPANYLALNPDALQKAIETEGESLTQGMQNLLSDMRAGRISQTDESGFEVGKNIATTEGAVVYENPFFQLIEYKALTDKVHERPFLFIPPCINKFYILDLQPSNSLIRYAIEQGHRTFVLSWRNPDETCAQHTWDDYIEQAAITAIHQVKDLTGSKDINALGFCVGGTILSNALAVLAARKDKSVASATFLTTLMDFSNSGILDVFIDEAMVAYREQQMGQGGLLSGKDLASTFNFLRPNDLVWNYVQNNYMLGKTPPAFDLLYWNGDSTNLPGPMYTWYLRNTYLENNLIKPGHCTVAGEKIDLRKITIPVYLYGSREDHIVPIEGAYASTQHLGSKNIRFVMGASGHIAGVINPAKAGKRSYWSNDTLPQQYQDWLAGSQEHPGSWWSDWSTWLGKQGGKKIPAPKTYCSKAIEPAPGRYVKAKATAVA